jgi:hypothetical protein
MVVSFACACASISIRTVSRKELRMARKSSWERFFDAHAPIYDENVFTKNTVREVDFLLAELNLPKGGSVPERRGIGEDDLSISTRSR